MVTYEVVEDHKKFEIEMDIENLIRAELATRRRKTVSGNEFRTSDNTSQFYS